MNIDEVAYLDQLHEQAQTQVDPIGGYSPSKIKFFRIVFDIWPEISRAFDEHKHSL